MPSRCLQQGPQQLEEFVRTNQIEVSQYRRTTRQPCGVGLQLRFQTLVNFFPAHRPKLVVCCSPAHNEEHELWRQTCERSGPRRTWGRRMKLSVSIMCLDPTRPTRFARQAGARVAPAVNRLQSPPRATPDVAIGARRISSFFSSTLIPHRAGPLYAGLGRRSRRLRRGSARVVVDSRGRLMGAGFSKNVLRGLLCQQTLVVGRVSFSHGANIRIVRWRRRTLFRREEFLTPHPRAQNVAISNLREPIVILRARFEGTPALFSDRVSSSSSRADMRAPPTGKLALWFGKREAVRA